MVIDLGLSAEELMSLNLPIAIIPTHLAADHTQGNVISRCLGITVTNETMHLILLLLFPDELNKDEQMMNNRPEDKEDEAEEHDESEFHPVCSTGNFLFQIHICKANCGKYCTN